MNFLFKLSTYLMALSIVALAITVTLFLPDNIRQKHEWLNKFHLSLGLDLRGGSQLLLQVDRDSYINDQLDVIIDDIRARFRENKIGYQGGFRKSNQVVTASLRDIADISNAKKALRELGRDFIVEISDSGTVSVKYSDEGLSGLNDRLIAQSIEIIRKRVDETGTKEPVIHRQGKNRILLQVAGLEDPSELKALLGKTAKMSFHMAHPSQPSVDRGTMAANGYMVVKGYKDDPAFYHIEKKISISGNHLVDAQLSYGQEGLPEVYFRFDTLGAKKFAKITRNNVNRRFAIMLDKEIITAPNINQPITGGDGVIEGRFSVAEASRLAVLMRTGALPAPIDIIQANEISATLGKDSINSGLKASFLGVLLVIAMMVVFYRGFGIFAVTALLVNMCFVLVLISAFGITLTLPGIAGLVLTLGMAVDANVLIFERIREEINSGKKTMQAVDAGFGYAYKTIVDSNVTTLIATILLFVFGSGPIQGFAITLMVGILCSMFTAINISRLMIVGWVNFKRPKKLII